MDQEVAQAAKLYRDDPEEFPVDAVPASRGLKWNPPCSRCGNYRLTMPEVLVACVPLPVGNDDA
jgi:hypothetical protein